MSTDEIEFLSKYIGFLQQASKVLQKHMEDLSNLPSLPKPSCAYDDAQAELDRLSDMVSRAAARIASKLTGPAGAS